MGRFRQLAPDALEGRAQAGDPVGIRVPEIRRVGPETYEPFGAAALSRELVLLPVGDERKARRWRVTSAGKRQVEDRPRRLRSLGEQVPTALAGRYRNAQRRGQGRHHVEQGREIGARAGRAPPANRTQSGTRTSGSIRRSPWANQRSDSPRASP